MRKSTLGGKPAKMTPESPTRMTEGDVHGSGSKSGQYPGERQQIGEAEAGPQQDELAPATSVRGVDPNLAGHYVRSARSQAQGAAPGKTQVKNPNQPLKPSMGGTLGSEGGQFPGIPVPLPPGNLDGIGEEDVDGALGGATRGPQPRERNVGGARGGQYPGIPQEVEDINTHMVDTDAQLGLDESLDPREVGGPGYRNDRNVASPSSEQGDGKDYSKHGNVDEKAEPGMASHGAGHHG